MSVSTRTLEYIKESNQRALCSIYIAHMQPKGYRFNTVDNGCGITLIKNIFAFYSKKCPLSYSEFLEGGYYTRENGYGGSGKTLVNHLSKSKISYMTADANKESIKAHIDMGNPVVTFSKAHIYLLIGVFEPGWFLNYVGDSNPELLEFAQTNKDKTIYTCVNAVFSEEKNGGKKNVDFVMSYSGLTYITEDYMMKNLLSYFDMNQSDAVVVLIHGINDKELIAHEIFNSNNYEIYKDLITKGDNHDQ